MSRLKIEGIFTVGLFGGLMVGNHLPVQEMQISSLGREDSLEKEMTTPFNILVWEISSTEESVGL